ncbi:hypothetical protein NP493_34g02009 [Ridgeia piscesae]|uniref:Uncharacterized protein n=1 Tax=Ridgeia piscesae TaxID=27915 RepID=A0AAD9UJX7_RIDPI|nr:hypothetical protein NP493_34g02009 [Ridgeia piscesae]
MLDDTSYKLKYQCASPVRLVATEHDDTPVTAKDTVTRCTRLRRMSGLQPFKVDHKITNRLFMVNNIIKC